MHRTLEALGATPEQLQPQAGLPNTALEGITRLGYPGGGAGGATAATSVVDGSSPRTPPGTAAVSGSEFASASVFDPQLAACFWSEKVTD